MSDAIVKYGYTSEQVDLIKDQICKGASNAQLDLFMATSQRLSLDPFAKQIYAVMRGGSMVIQVGIDGFRSVAESSGDYQGQTPTQWCGDDLVWHEVWISNDYPAAARVGVWRAGFREPLYAVATWASYVQMYSGKPADMWNRFPDVMLAKCAESLALRKAFPRSLSGLYTPDEMAQASNDAVRVAEVIPREQTYDDPEQAAEKERVRAIALGFSAGALPGIDECIDGAVEEMLGAEGDEAEQAAITKSHAALMRSWFEDHGDAYARTCCLHPAATNEKSKVFRRLQKWAKAAGVPLDDVAMMARAAVAAVDLAMEAAQ